MNNHLVCPHCKKEIEISEAFRHQIQEEVGKELTEKHQKEIEDLRHKMQEEIQKKLHKQFEEEQEELKEELIESKERIAKFREQELDLRKKTRELEEQKEEMALEVEKRLSEEKKRIEETVLKRALEEHRLKDLEKEKVINDLKKALEEAQIKAAQGSQQLQGEVFELDIEDLLRTSFPQDSIEEVGKGIKGADVKHIVKSRMGKPCGVILWEIKRTKNWTDGWIDKLKTDVRNEKANVPVIVTTALPADIENGLGIKDGVWICSFNFILPLAMLLRDRLHDVAKERFIQNNRGSTTDLVYDYVTGHEFKQQVEALVEVFAEMQNQVHKERIAYEKSWKQREAQVRKLFLSTASIYGSMQGLIGSSMPQVRGLELDELESGE
ncbi:MAG: hypothetical protein UU14_C0003G0019 [Candidatus Roizmanbacteria bacterium GW2011_GWB1_40_7]|uniref:DUF2130 domain-containing protein n=2 Tax=Candidatus Roizmaniibacteriota TaxID=1752723 RepID=A0A0G0TCX0_9BACT|nr:MAG: hypothetical protein UU14_C0003G0019 [Candidatus Roizmanbacteria bacterium GW2011_GWB1_40_7]KKR91620.1 MAG: hypothetical protein UU41_C0034G0004 [Candidatus Roizmanbacteria bacterium GW2011_GWA1_41_13]